MAIQEFASDEEALDSGATGNVKIGAEVVWIEPPPKPKKLSKPAKLLLGMAMTKTGPSSEAFKLIEEGADLKGKSGVKKAATVAQLSSGFIPLVKGPKAIAAGTVDSAGEFIRARAEGKSVSDSLKPAITSGTITGLMEIINMGALRRATKVISDDATQEIGKRILKNPRILKESPKSVGDIIKKGHSALKNQRFVKGKQVGEAKKLARESGAQVNLSDIIKKSADLKEKSKLVVPEGKVAVQELVGQTTSLKRIDKILESQKLTKGGGLDFDDAETVLESMDNVLEKTYKKILKGESLSTSEKVALDVRRATNKSISDSVGDIASKKGLTKSKKEFSDFVNLTDDHLIKRMKKDRDAMSSVVKSALREGKEETFEKIVKLDNALPKGERFLDDFLGKQVNKQFNNLGFTKEGIKSSWPDVLVRKVATPAPILGTATRRALVDQPFVSKEEIGGFIQQGVGSGIPSMNSILFGNDQGQRQ